MTDNKNNNSCFSCSYRKSICIKSGLKFVICKDHYCTLQEKLILGGVGCEMWKKGQAKFDLSPPRFDTIEKDLNIILIDADKL